MIQKPIDLKVKDFKNDLISLINDYELPLSVSYLIMQDVARLVNSQLQENLATQEQQYQEQLIADNIENTEK